MGKFEANTPEWDALREGSIGGSSVGAILGVSPWKSAYTLYQEMVGAVEVEFAPNDAMLVGTFLEDGLVKLFAYKHPEFDLTVAPGIFRSTKSERFHANPDALIFDEHGNTGILEIKTSRSSWTEVPESYVAQVRWYMWIMDADFAIVAGYIGGEYREFRIERDDFLEEWMIEAVNRFVEHYDKRVAPAWDGSDSTYQTVREMHLGVEPGSVELDALGVQLMNAKTEFDVAQANLNLAKSIVLDFMGDTKTGLLNGDPICYRKKASTGTPYLQFS